MRLSSFGKDDQAAGILIQAVHHKYLPVFFV